MNAESFREMNPRERALVAKLLAEPFPGRDELSQQLENAKVRTLDENGSLEFSVDSRPAENRIRFAIPTEGEYEDPDGVTVHILLYAANGRAQRLVLHREDDLRVQAWVDPQKLRVFAPKYGI